ncbi:ribosome hibernation factor-recruiting GTPase MRF [Mycobacterium sp. CnD-18-1]|uniref:ribosome hibernation factor-recruiting GTPase MRF n=1 Tax=Mycobacterium sp. CnD-18-1 TaxID=2917744 RepID=UPI001EF194F3|nr:GTP-binding protein [Mycobacterium sp. CnD-18-1]MCG7607292.1 GTP-binding protein [Mycobacterium sp. CnD-18-1]
MRTPVVLVAGQGDVEGVADQLSRCPGTVLVRHTYDGQVVLRNVTDQNGSSEMALELAHGCVTCTVRDDLLILLRRLHRRSDVTRIVVALMGWLEPEPVCWAIENIHVQVGPGYIDGPAARDVSIAAVTTCIDTQDWLRQAVGDDELGDGRTVAQVVVGQAEFADALVLTEPEATTLSVLRRLAPRARITVGTQRVETALAHLDPGTRRGRVGSPHDPLLDGQPPLDQDGEVGIVEFTARRPFHPLRLHAAIDPLLEGVVRTRGRAWLANRPAEVMWIESAGGGLHFSSAGKWLAAMDSTERAYTDPERLAMAAIDWDNAYGDRHVSLTVLVCGARPDEITDALRDALLTDDELAHPGEWAHYPDPFGDWHEDPCDDQAGADEAATRGHHEGGQP